MNVEQPMKKLKLTPIYNTLHLNVNDLTTEKPLRPLRGVARLIIAVTGRVVDRFSWKQKMYSRSGSR